MHDAALLLGREGLLLTWKYQRIESK